MTGNLIPPRVEGVICRPVDDGFVVVDPRDSTAVALDGDAAIAWAAAGGTTAALTTERADAAVAELRALGLLEGPRGLDRRTLLKRTGILATGVGVSSVLLPMAAAAASGNGGQTPSISLGPASGPKGTTVSVTGSGFATVAGRTISSVTIGGVTVTPSSTTISSLGTFTFTFTVPSAVGTGAQTVTVTDNHHNSASKTFTVTTPSASVGSLTFTKNASPVTRSASGSGFAPNSTITVSGTGGFSATPTSITASALGTFGPLNLTVSYPQGASKAGTLTFTGSGGNAVTLNVTTGP